MTLCRLSSPASAGNRFEAWSSSLRAPARSPWVNNRWISRIRRSRSFPRACWEKTETGFDHKNTEKNTKVTEQIEKRCSGLKNIRVFCVLFCVFVVKRISSFAQLIEVFRSKWRQPLECGTERRRSKGSADLHSPNTSVMRYIFPLISIGLPADGLFSE